MLYPPALLFLPPKWNKVIDWKPINPTSLKPIFSILAIQFLAVSLKYLTSCSSHSMMEKTAISGVFIVVTKILISAVLFLHGIFDKRQTETEKGEGSDMEAFEKKEMEKGGLIEVVKTEKMSEVISERIAMFLVGVGFYYTLISLPTAQAITLNLAPLAAYHVLPILLRGLSTAWKIISMLCCFGVLAFLSLASFPSDMRLLGSLDGEKVGDVALANYLPGFTMLLVGGLAEIYLIMS